MNGFRIRSRRRKEAEPDLQPGNRLLTSAATNRWSVARRGGLAPTDGTGYGINPNFNSFVGSEIDLVGTYAIKRYASLQAGIGHFFVGDYVKSSLARIGGTRDATFAYLQFTLNF